MVYLDKALHYGLLAIAFSLPFIRLNHITEYVFLSLLIVWLGRKLLTKSFGFEKTSLDLPLLLFLGWVLLTIPFATNWSYSLGEWQKSIPRFLMFWFALNVVKTEQDVRSLLHAFSLGFVLLVLVETSHFFWQGGDPLSKKVRAGTFSGSSQWFSCFLVIGIPVLWLGLVGGERRWIRGLYLSALAMSAVGLILVHTRAAWVAVMTQGLFSGVLKLTKNWMVSGMVAFLSVILLIGFLAIPGKHREMISISDLTSTRSMVKRFNTWEIAFNDIREHPLMGIGYGKRSFHLKHPDLGRDFHSHVHNFFLSSAVQVGIPGFLFLAWIFWVVLYKSSQWSQKFPNQYLGNLSIAMFLITLGLMVRILFDDMLIGSVVYLFMVLLGACFSFGGQIAKRAKNGMY